MPLNPVRAVLPNGVAVIAKANHTTSAVSVLMAVGAGAWADPPNNDGTAALVARVLDRGTTSRSADRIADELDGSGASLGVSASRFQVTLSATCLTGDFGHVLGLMSDIAFHPTFPEAEVTTRRTELVTTIRQDLDQPAVVAVDAFMRALYGGHAFARRVRGTVPTVDALTRTDLVAFHQAWFAPDALTVVVVGDVDEAAVAGQVLAVCDHPPRANRPGPIVVPDAGRPAARQVVTEPMPGKAQADVAYGFVGIRRHDPHYMATAVMNNALGQYALGGRLGDSIRERQGMAYYVFSSLDAGPGEGPLVIRAGVSASNVDRTIASIDDELAALCRDGFAPKEIDESKRYLIGSLPRQLETNAAIASFLLTSEQFGLGLDYDARLPALVDEVTLDQANAAARRLLDPARATVAVAGPTT